MAETKNYSPRYERPKLNAAMKHAGTLVGKVHPMCNAFPTISRQDFDNLVDAIKENGLIEPISINRDKELLDGRSRLMACLVAGVAITSDHVKIAEHSPEAIAQSNVARRHLTLAFKLMRAADRLAEYRRLAAIKKAAGAEKGRQSQKQADRAKFATSQETKKRGTRAVEVVSKEEAVPRAELALVEKILRVDPELKPTLESGELSLDEAAELVGVPRKPTKGSRPKKQKSSRQQRDLDAVTEHGDGICQITAPGVSVFTHPDLKISIMVFGTDNDMLIGATDDDEHVAVNPEAPLAQQAIERLTQRLSKAT